MGRGGGLMVYRFGEFSLDTASLELKQNETLLEVEPQVFSLLSCLIENRGRVVTKDELIDNIWGGRIITDGALNTRINALRRAVGDDGQTQSVIKTYRNRGFRFVAEVANIDETTLQNQALTPISDKPSIAVLPFNNLSDDPGQEYFADGITEDLITGISKLSGLTVIGRNSSFFYKEKEVDLGQVGQELGVNFVLEGSVRKAGERVRITAQLTDLCNAGLVWADSHDGTLGDVFDLQDEITGRILSALSVQLGSEAPRLISKYTDSPEAHDWFMQARIRYREPGPQANGEAHGMFDRAIAADPKFAAAFAIRSYVKFHAWFFKWNAAASLPDALADAQIAVQFDVNLAAAHSYLGWMHMWDHDHDRALAEHEIALKLDPNSAEGYVWYASTLIYSGRPEFAIDPMERAIRLDPHHPPNFLVNFGNMYLQLGCYEEAERYLNTVRKMAPDFPVTYIFLAAVHAAAGDIEGSKNAGAEIIKRIPGATSTMLGRQFPYAKPEHLKRMTDGLRIAGLPD